MKSCVLYDRFKVIFGNLVQVAWQAADLNPTENLWEILEWHVRKCSPPPSSLICINGNYHICCFFPPETCQNTMMLFRWLVAAQHLSLLVGKMYNQDLFTCISSNAFSILPHESSLVWPSAPNFPIGLTKDTPAYTHASGMHTSTLSCLPGDIH